MQNINVLLTVMEASKSKIKVPAGSVFSESSFHIHGTVWVALRWQKNRCTQKRKTMLCSQTTEGRRAKWAHCPLQSFYKVVHSMIALTLWFNHLLKIPPLNTIILTIRFQHMDSEGSLKPQLLPSPGVFTWLSLCTCLCLNLFFIYI
jgi:hypothetical protein